MNDIIEEKVHLDTKILFSIAGLVIFLKFTDLLIAVSDPNADTTIRFMFFSFLFIIIMALLFYSPFFLKSATKLTLGDDAITVKLAFRKPLIIPLENIQKINECGYAGNRPFHFIKTKEKNFNTLLISMSLSKKSLAIFTEELQRRVYMARQKQSK